MTLCYRLFCFLALFSISGLAATPTSHAQFTSVDNVCTLFDQLPPTQGVRSTLSEEWDGSAFVTVSRTIYNRNADEEITEIIYQERSAGAWVNEVQALPEFENGLLTVCTLQDWDPNKAGAWVNAARTTRTYENGRVATSVGEVWDDEAGSWQNGSRSEFGYDEDGNLTQQINQGWDGSIWRNSTRITNTYEDGNRTMQLVETWAGFWLNSRRTTSSYTSTGRPDETLEENWDLINSRWVNAFLTSFSYENKALTVTEIRQQWNGATWVDLARTTTDLNDDDLPTLMIEDRSEGANWIRTDRTETSYLTVNGEPKFLTILDQSCASDCAVAKIAWENVSRITFSYSEVLPVELTRFTVAASGRDALLRWDTASETNNAGFEVQRRLRADAPFAPIGFVDGAGTTSAPQRYRFTDAGLPFTTATVTYRLKQIDFDGAFDYSPQVELQLGGTDRLVLHGTFPNPARARTTIRYEVPTAGPVHLAVYNLLGQHITSLVDAQRPAGRHEVRFDASGLSSGVYFVRLQMADRALTRRLTVVQ